MASNQNHPEDFTKRVFDETHACKALGFSVGSVVRATKKIEVEVVHGRLREKHQKQVNKGQEGKVVELGKDTLKVQFTVQVNNKDHVVTKEVPLSAVEKPEAPEQQDQDDPAVLGPPLPPGHEWARMPCKEVSLVQWPTQPEKDPSQKVHTLKSSIGFIMGAMAPPPTYSRGLVITHQGTGGGGGPVYPEGIEALEGGPVAEDDYDLALDYAREKNLGLLLNFTART